MRRRSLGIALMVFPIAWATSSPAEEYGWTISSSSTDPFQNSGPVTAGLPSTVHLWYACAPAGSNDLIGAEFRMTFANSVFLAWTLNSPFYADFSGGDIFFTSLNTPPIAPARAASVLFLPTSPLGVEICVVPHSQTGLNVTVVPNCEDLTAALHTNAVIGWSSDAPSGCVTGLCASPVGAGEQEITSWGHLKSMYRSDGEGQR